MLLQQDSTRTCLPALQGTIVHVISSIPPG
jgi:hypothetical protein